MAKRPTFLTLLSSDLPWQTNCPLRASAASFASGKIIFRLSYVRYPIMDCQICLRQLERFEPVYRMQFGPQINEGWPTSVCSRCLSAFVESLKRPGLRDRFRSPKPCELCGRPVYNLKRWTVTRVICSLRCRGELAATPEKRVWASFRS